MELDYVTITDNSALEYGGGLYCYQSNMELDHVTISGNSAGYGGGFTCFDSSNVSLLNSILWNNIPDEINISSGTVTVSYSDIQGGWPGTGNLDSDPLFVNPAAGDYQLTWASFPIPDATISPCIDTGDPSSPLDPDETTADMGAFYYDQSPGAPLINAVTDVPGDQGRQVQVIWDRSPLDAPNSPNPIETYSLWRYDDIFGGRGFAEIYEDPRELLENAVNDSGKNYYWQRDGEILTFIAQLPAMEFVQYSVVSPTLMDSSVVSVSYSAFKVFAHTDEISINFPSHPDSGYSVDNIAPDATTAFAASLDESTVTLSWDEVEYGTFEGNSYPELNGVWYRIYAGDTPWFTCDEEHLLTTVTEPHFDYPVSGETKKFFRVVVSDQEE